MEPGRSRDDHSVQVPGVDQRLPAAIHLTFRTHQAGYIGPLGGNTGNVSVGGALDRSDVARAPTSNADQSKP
jgi:hypothetical protein